MTEQTNSRRWPWRRIARYWAEWALALLAAQAVVFYLGHTPMSVPVLIATFALGCLVSALLLRRNPAYYDRRWSMPDA